MSKLFNIVIKVWLNQPCFTSVCYFNFNIFFLSFPFWNSFHATMFSAIQSSVMSQLAKAAAESRPVQIYLVRMATTSSPVNAAQAGVCPIANHGMANSDEVLPAPHTTGANVLSEARPYDDMPGPKGLPVLGSLLDYTKLGRLFERVG